MSKVVPTRAASIAALDHEAVVSTLDPVGLEAAGSMEVFMEAVSREAEASVVAEVT
jgi:hypothetical protein